MKTYGEKMLKRTLPFLMTLAVILTACAPQGTPTMASADVQGTAVSSAWTMVAMTQLAIPTSTPVPPSDTPSPSPMPIPTDTPNALPLPTLANNILPTATQAAGSGDCLNPIDMGQAGPRVNVKIENASSGIITSMFLKLSPPNAFGQCGVISYANIGKNGSVVVALPKGSWYAGAWVRLKNGSSASVIALFTLRVGDFDQLRLTVRDDKMFLHP